MTKLFNNILLVLTDKSGDKDALRRAIELAKINNSTIKIVKVIENLTKLIEVSQPSLHRIIDIKKMIINDLENTIVKKITKSNRNLSVTCKLLEGTAFIEIIKEVKRYKHDLLILSSEGEKDIDAGFLNGTNFHLLRKCPCPVWVVKPSRKPGCKHILAAVDLDQDDKVKTQLNKKIIETALLLANKYKSKLHVFFAWQVYGESALKNSPFLKVTKSELTKIIKDEKVINSKAMENFIKQFSSRNVTLHPQLHKGHPVKLIPNFIKRNRVDLVVMGTVCRVGIPGLIIGNTAEEILRKINCSVLTIKPDGFVSLVE